MVLALVAACATPPVPPDPLAAPELRIEAAVVPGDALGGPLAFDGADSHAPGAGSTAETSESLVAEAEEGPVVPSGGEPAAGEPAAETSTAPGLPVRLRALYLAQPSPEGLTPVAGKARVIADLSGARPVLPTAELTASALHVAGDGADSWLGATLSGAEHVVLLDQTTTVPHGASLRVGLEADERVPDPRDWLDEFEDRGPITRRVGVTLTHGTASPSLSLEVSDMDPEAERALLESILIEPNAQAGPPGPAQDEKVRHEALQIDGLVPSAGPLVLHLPSPFDAGNGSTIVFVIETGVEGDAGTAAAADAELSEAINRYAASSEPMTDMERVQVERTEALRAFRERGGRPALLLLAQESGAALALDLAVVADAAFLARLAALALPAPAENAGAPAAPAKDPAAAPMTDSIEGQGSDEEDLALLGWRIDAAAWTLLAQDAMEEALDDELSGLFLRNAGALARFPDLLLDAVASAGGSPETFDERMVIEHRLFLEDSSASNRVRAHEWLLARGRAVSGFDPLAPREDRRAILEAAAAQNQAGGESR